MPNIKSVEARIESLYQQFVTCWIAACKLEQADPTSAAVELSDDNPFRLPLAKLNEDILLYEHTLRYLYLQKPKRDAEITGAKL